MATLEQLLAQLRGLWVGLSGAQRIALLSIALLTTGAVALLVQIGRTPDYGILYANLSPEDSAKILDELTTRNIEYRLTHAGTSIQVPNDRIYDLRLDLASEGLPAAGPVGFEVFEEGGLGMTPFQQRIRYRRALEGELGRTISRLAPVHWARVHVNIPEKAVFARKSQKPSASVVLSLVSGRTLESTQSRGIAQLVAGAVEGLDPNQVSILDSRGRMLARPSSDEGDALAADALDVRRSLERELSQRVQTILDAALGMGGSVVTVAATIDMRRVEETQNSVDPDQSVVVSEQRVEETRTEPALSAAGIPGTQSNVPGGPGAETSLSEPSTETISRETINFEVTRATSHTVIPIGALQRLSVAVLVDGTYVTPEAVEGEAPGVATYQPRSTEELHQIAEIVKRAVGFDQERGDVIEVQNLPFRSPLATPEQEPSLWQRPEVLLLMPGIVRAIAVIGGILLLALLVIRPALRQLATSSSGVVAVGGRAVRAGAAGEGAEAIQLEESAELAVPLSKDQARLVADAMKQWLRE
jgi:flagellar M-ring protein FliF